MMYLAAHDLRWNRSNWLINQLVAHPQPVETSLGAVFSRTGLVNLLGTESSESCLHSNRSPSIQAFHERAFGGASLLSFTTGLSTLNSSNSPCLCDAEAVRSCKLKCHATLRSRSKPRTGTYDSNSLALVAFTHIWTSFAFGRRNGERKEEDC
ncbi:hypothetical protein DM02DRAFT_411674 [Periconia macrospinosa]|uniref:Uncharacterized protein n=1 Tax=Periconia macrospinosa TaxID=97972 RepID=A0A2V1DPY5_9PLEO|nr:hypothetical protein DM02DRAFT_411674 [Periconia macrospinosa]